MGGKKKSKNSGHNAFFFFMMDLKKRHGYQSNNEASLEAGKYWEQMSASARKPYEDMARKHKPEKMTNHGIRISDIESMQEEKRIKEETMKNTTEKLVKMCLELNTIRTKYFHILHINYFCLHEEANIYFPAEIAICRFNFEDGVLVNNVYHSLIYPGKLPIGYGFRARNHSEETHKLPTNEDNLDNIEEVYGDVMRFLGQENFPPVFVDESNIKVVESVFSHFFSSYGDCSEISICSLEYFLYILRNNITDIKVWPSMSMSRSVLERDCYDYINPHLCSYHDTIGEPLFCSKSLVTRYAFLICDHCCEDIGVKIIPGRHVPTQAATSSIRHPLRLNSAISRSSQTMNSTTTLNRTESVVSILSDSTITDSLNSRFNNALNFISDVDEEDQDWQHVKSNKKQTHRMKEYNSSSLNESSLDDSSSETNRSTSQKKKADKHNDNHNVKDIEYSYIYNKNGNMFEQDTSTQYLDEACAVPVNNSQSMNAWMGFRGQSQSNFRPGGDINEPDAFPALPTRSSQNARSEFKPVSVRGRRKNFRK